MALIQPWQYVSAQDFPQTSTTYHASIVGISILVYLWLLDLSPVQVNTLLQQRLHRFEKGSVLNLRMQERSKPFCKIAFDVPVLQLSVSLDTFPALSYVRLASL